MLRSPSADRPCRFGIPVHLKSAVLLLGALALLAGPAGAADFYGTGKLAISNAMGDTSGEITGLFPLTGDDNDTSPVFGGAVGFGFQYNEVLPMLGSTRKEYRS